MRNEYYELEQHLLTADFILADDKYISDGNFIFSKDYIKSKALKNVKNIDDIFVHCANTVPFEKGEEFICTMVGTECILMAHQNIGIVYNDLYLFDYDYIKWFVKQVPNWEYESFYVVENAEGVPILKMFVNDKFVACLMSAKRKRG